MVNNNTLPVTNIVDITLEGAPVNLAIENLNTIALISQEKPTWYGSQDYAIYQSSSQVEADFGSSSVAFAVASAIFAQNPNVLGSGGYLTIIPRKTVSAVAASLKVQDLTYTAVATGESGNEISIGYIGGGIAGSEVVTVTGDAIQVKIQSGVSTATQVEAAINASSPATALVSVAVSGTGTNPQTAPYGPTYLAGGNGMIETIAQCIARTLNEVYYFGILGDEDFTALPGNFSELTHYIQSLDKMMFYATSHPSDVENGGILQLNTSAANSNTRGLYYSDGNSTDTFAFAGAYAGRALSTDFNATDSTDTMNLKTLAGVMPDATVTQTFYNTAITNGVDVYPAVGSPNNGYVISSGANQFFDQIYNQFWFKFATQTDVFNALAGTYTKIPQTEIGMTALKGVVLGVCQQAVTNGFVAPGTWSGAVPFGDPADFARAIADFGYYIYSQPVSQQSESQRASRIAPVIQVALKSAGAVQQVIGNVFVSL